MIVKKKVGRPKLNTSKDIDRGAKERILSIAMKVFANKGFEGARVQDILDEANVNISMISYYFGGKDGLYLDCLRKATSVGVEASARILTPPTSTEEFKIRISIFFEEIIRFSLEHKAEVTLIRRENERPSAITKNIILPSITGTILNFFRSAQKNKILRPEIDIKILAAIFFTTIISLANESSLISEFTGKEISNESFRSTVLKHFLLLLEGTIQP